MPTYTYLCKKCEALQDVFHAMSESPRVKCNACGSVRMTRLLGTGAGIMFKGSGFYETDYKKNGNGHGKNGSKTEASSESKSESKSDSKSSKSDASKSGSGKGKDA